MSNLEQLLISSAHTRMYINFLSVRCTLPRPVSQLSRWSVTSSCVIAVKEPPATGKGFTLLSFYVVFTLIYHSFFFMNRYECPPGCFYKYGKVLGSGYYDVVRT